MSSVPMPRDLSEEAVAEWLRERQASWPVEVYPGTDRVSGGYFHREDVNVWLARAVRSLVEQKVREAVALDRENSYAEENRYWEGPASVKNELTVNAIVSRVMGDQPSNASGGQGAEGDQVTRG